MGLSLLLASAVSGCISHVFAHPIDTIRTRMMVSTSQNASLTSVSSKLLQADGARGLYRGFTISLLMQAPAVATFLTAYDWSKDRTARYTTLSSESPVVHLSSGLFAETVSAVFWVPMEVIKQRAQVRKGAVASASSSAIVRDLLLHEGPRALFKGYGLTIAVFGPYSMLYFMAYEKFKSLALQSTHSGHSSWLMATSAIATTGGTESIDAELSVPQIAVCAGVAGAIAAGATTPLDIIKTRLQTQGDCGTVSVEGSHRTYHNSWQAARSIVLRDGAAGFFRGVSARVLWIIPGTSITMSLFEFFKSHYNLSA